MENKVLLAQRLETLSVFTAGLFLLLFPVMLATITTDAFVIPKQTVLGLVVLTGVLIMGAKAILNQAVRLRRTPFDVPVALLAIAAFLSAIFAINRADALISFIPFLFAILLFFIITNSAKKSQDVFFLTGALVAGGVLVSLITLLSYLKVYILPFEFAKNQTFTPFGSLFDQAIYLFLVLSVALYMAWPALKRRTIDNRKLIFVDKGRLIFVIGSVLLLAGTAVSIIATLTLQKPTLLPYQTGFQTAFAAISQDSGRVVQGFLMGSGIGTFLSDFTRFKPAEFNLSPTLWNLSFLRSSSYVLEILATMGLLGILSFGFLAYRIIRSKPLFVPLLIALVLSIILPFSFTLIVLLFALLALYSAGQGLLDRQKTRFFDVELKLVTLKKGVFALTDPETRRDSEYGNILPFGFLVMALGFSLLVGFLALRFLYSDYLFQQSLVSASKNDAQKTYKLQTDAIKMFPQRDGYHRIFSQINLSLANNLASSVPQGSSPSAQTQQTIYQLIQQSINSGRTATSVSPQTSANWQNLSSIYRGLIGFGQNADTFAILANQRAVQLDPNNPQQYINYGGIFYQLGQWDNAIRQFQIAVTLKPDFANAYYNLGHALEQKGDLEQALSSYQRVRSLVGSDKKSVEQINKEIKALEGKIGTSTNNQQAQTGTSENQPPLGINQPAAKLPEQKNPVEIPGPTATPTPKATPTPAR